MWTLLKWTVFLPFTILAACVASDTIKEAVFKLFVAFVIFPIVILAVVVWIAASVFSEWGMPEVEIEHHKVLNDLRQIDSQIKRCDRIIGRLDMHLTASKVRLKEDIRAAKVSDLPLPRPDGYKMIWEGHERFFIVPPQDTWEQSNNPHPDSFGGMTMYDTGTTNEFMTFEEYEDVINAWKNEMKRLKAVRAPYYEKHLEFHKVREEAQAEAYGDGMASWMKSVREKIGNEYADDGALVPESYNKQF
jgi:hypothetical protein